MEPSAVTLMRLSTTEAEFGGAAGSEAGLALMADEVMRSPADNRNAAWVTQLKEVIASICSLRREMPALVSAPAQEDAILRLTLALVPSYEGTNAEFVKYAYDASVEKYMFHIANHGIIELVSAYPSEWDRIAGLMMESGLSRPEEISAVLDGTISPALASGIL